MTKKRKSCKSHGERIINEYLSNNNIYYLREYKDPKCINSKGNSLRFDFYIPNYLLFIEFQGKHHYEPINKHYRAKKVHETTLIHDQIKKQFCIDNNYCLLEINYKEIKNINNILDNIISMFKNLRGEN